MPRDKILHIIAGAVIAAALSLVLTPVMGFFAGVIAGAAKEIRDRYTEGATEDWMDFGATAGGAVIGALLVYTVY